MGVNLHHKTSVHIIFTTHFGQKEILMHGRKQKRGSGLLSLLRTILVESKEMRNMNANSAHTEGSSKLTEMHFCNV